MDEDKAMVIFQPSGRRGEVPKGITVIEASRLLKYYHRFVFIHLLDSFIFQM